MSASSSTSSGSLAPSRSETANPTSGLLRTLIVLASIPLASCGLSAHRSPHLAAGRPATTAPPLGSPLRIVVWNVHKQTDSVFFAELGSLLDSSRADIAMLQEVAIPSDPEAFDRALSGRSWSLSANLRRSDPGQQIGVATASRVPAVGSEALLSASGEPLAGTRKAALATRYALGDRTLTVVNIHALNFSPSLDGFRHQLLDVASMLRDTGAPSIVAGDFNTWRTGKLALADSIMGSIGLKRLDFGNHEPDKKRVFGNALDHVYYTPSHLVPDPASLRVHTRFTSSDHVPLEAAFTLTPAATVTR